MSNDWIHTRRGVTLVEGTLPKLARAIESAAAELKRFNDREEIQAELAELREQVKSLSPQKQLTYEEGCMCPSCRLRRGAEAIADEPDHTNDCHLRGD